MRLQDQAVKSEGIARRGPWRHCEAVELATLKFPIRRWRSPKRNSAPAS